MSLARRDRRCLISSLGMLKNTKSKKSSTLTLTRETIQVLADKDLTIIGGGFGATAHCTVSAAKLSNCGCATE